MRAHVCGVFFFKQKTAYEMRISDWSSDVCSSDLISAETRYLGNGVVEASGRFEDMRSEERRVGKEVSVRVDLGGRRIIKKKINRFSIHNSITKAMKSQIS